MTIFGKPSFCPNCASAEIHRSRRKGLLEQILHTIFLISPYRCKACDERYFRLRVAAAPAEKPRRHAA
jgi:predicted Zn-ribbon and HTH transcriptional regulator